MVGHRIAFTVAGGALALAVGPVAHAAGGGALGSWTVNADLIQQSFALALPGPAALDDDCGGCSGSSDFCTMEYERLLTIGYQREIADLDDVTYDGDLFGTSLGDPSKAERFRSGVFARIGVDCFGLDVAAFRETLVLPINATINVPGTGAVAIGDLRVSDATFQFGISGAPRWSMCECSAWVIDYGANINFGSFSDQGLDLTVTEEQLWLGIGLDIAGFQATVGGMADFMQLDIDGSNFEATGESLGGYGRLAYRAKHLPIYASGTVFIGDYNGVALKAGLSF